MEGIRTQTLLRAKLNSPWNCRRPVGGLHGCTWRDRARVRCSQNPEFDVSGAVVQPSFRSAPIPQNELSEENQKVKILFVGESNVCRSVLAEACCKQLINESGLGDFVDCESKGTRDYNVGDSVDPSVASAALDMMVQIPKNFQARELKETEDIVNYDVLLVMDKYTAADVLREVSVFDTIQKGQGYSQKVRRLGEFHPRLRKTVEVDGQDIEDPLYGNVGGEEEQEAVKQSAVLIQSACLGLVEYLQKIQEESGGSTVAFKAALQKSIKSMEGIDWLVPPMLQPSSQR